MRRLLLLLALSSATALAQDATTQVMRAAQMANQQAIQAAQQANQRAMQDAGGGHRGFRKMNMIRHSLICRGFVLF
jgi:type IV secretory pathway VirB6-like protein